MAKIPMDSLTHRSGQFCPSLWATLFIAVGNVDYKRWANLPTAVGKTDTPYNIRLKGACPHRQTPFLHHKYKCNLLNKSVNGLKLIPCFPGIIAFGM